MITSIAEAICPLIASTGISTPIKTIVSIRFNISLLLFACPVEILPSCPVFIAFNIDNASSARTSPTMIRSGLERKAAFISSFISTLFSPAALAFLISRRTRFSIPLSFNSAESSMVMIRSPLGIQLDIPFNNVVFPLPVPPDIKMLYLAFTSIFKNCAISSENASLSHSHSSVIGSLANFRIVIVAPSIEIGGKIIFTLEPSSNLASTIGFFSFTIRFAPDATCWIT